MNNTLMTTEESLQVLTADQYIGVVTNWIETYGQQPTDEELEGALYLLAEATEAEGMIILSVAAATQSEESASLTAEQAICLEQAHNVYIDVTSLMYTTGNRNDEYGWSPVPTAWIEEAEEI